MAWSSKKQYAIMMSSKEGKDLVEKMPDLEQDEFQREFAKLLGKNPEGNFEEDDEDSDIKYIFEITPKRQEDLRKKFKWVFRKADEEYYKTFFDKFSKCGEEEKALFFQAMYETVSKLYQEKGKGFFSPYDRQISIDRRNLIEETCYEKYGVAFHEFGHAIDYTIGRKIKEGSYASSVYKNAKGETMEYILGQECNSCDWEGLKKEIDTMGAVFEQNRKTYWKQISDASLKKSELQEQIVEEASQKFFEDYKMTHIDFLNLIQDKYGQELTPEEAKAYSRVRNIQYEDIEALKDYVKPETLEELNKTKNDLKYLEKKYYENSQGVKRMYGDISDIYSGFTKNNGRNDIFGLPNVNMGHSNKYWRDRNIDQVARECFAELYQGKTVNKKSYKTMKKYFPRTVEIFEEIINKYGKDYAKRFGEVDE